MDLTFHHLCYILLVSNKSQVLPVPKGRGLYKDITHWRFTLGMSSILLENKVYVLLIFAVYILNKHA